jgi:hypothetical protein
MKTKYHKEITHTALQSYFSEQALDTIIQANIKQDRIKYQIAHDYIHFDGNAFARGFGYIQEQEAQIIADAKRSDYVQARQAFGRITHSWQDFYSHSNYVVLWMNLNSNQTPDQISDNDPSIIKHPMLASGKNYGLLELLATLPIFSTLVNPLMPKDSHAKMNLDSPSANPHFEYAYWAAYRATVSAYQNIIRQMETLPNHTEVIYYFNAKQGEK